MLQIHRDSYQIDAALTAELAVIIPTFNEQAGRDAGFSNGSGWGRTS